MNNYKELEDLLFTVAHNCHGKIKSYGKLKHAHGKIKETHGKINELTTE